MAWARHRYRGHKVWILVDETGEIVTDERGLASLRYRPEDERTYTVRPPEVRPLEASEDTPLPAGGAEGSSHIDVWTDGASSGNPGPAGIGVLLRWRGHEREISRPLGETTNNVAELTAVRIALNAIRRPELPVRLHTDSTYVIGVLQEGHRTKANAALIADIRREMARFADVQFVKVPAHAGHVENERVDALARACLRPGSGPERT